MVDCFFLSFFLSPPPPPPPSPNHLCRPVVLVSILTLITPYQSISSLHLIHTSTSFHQHPSHRYYSHAGFLLLYQHYSQLLSLSVESTHRFIILHSPASMTSLGKGHLSNDPPENSEQAQHSTAPPFLFFVFSFSLFLVFPLDAGLIAPPLRIDYFIDTRSHSFPWPWSEIKIFLILIPV